MDQHLLQGWQTDPFGLHEQRYFSAGRPTKLVRDGRVETYEEPPALPEGASPSGAAAGSASSADDLSVAAGLRESEAPGYLAHPTSAARAAAPIGDPSAPHRGVPVRRRTGLVNVLVALVVVTAVVVFVAIEGGFSSERHAGSGAPGTDLAAFVTRSAKTTLSEKTADVTLTATTTINGTQVDVRGSGQVDLASNASEFHVTANAAGISLDESEIMTSQAAYIEFTLNGQSLAQVLGGRHWMEILRAAAPMQDDVLRDSPAWSLQLLEQQGARVTPIGSRNVGGLTCNGYAVTPSQQSLLAAAQQEWAEMGLSSSEEAAARQMLESSNPPTILVWLDPTRNLTCELDVATQMGAGSGSTLSTENTQLTLTFTHYGVPVDITAPPASDTYPAQSEGTFQAQS